MQRSIVCSKEGILLINIKKAFFPIALGICVLVTGCSAIATQNSETDYRKNATILDKDSEFFSQPDKFTRNHLLFTASISNVSQHRKYV